MLRRHRAAARRHVRSRYTDRRYPYWVSDNFLLLRETGWRRERSLDRILQDVLDWIAWNADQHGQFYL